jgi:hypothetical protein
MAAKQWNQGPKDGQQPEAPAWMATFDSAQRLRAAGLGALLSGANLKNLALTLAAAASVAGPGLTQRRKPQLSPCTSAWDRSLSPER